MAAGKMFLAAKAGRRRYKRRTSGFKKAVSTIAKRVVLRQTETKTGTTGATGTFGSSGYFYSVNGGGLLSSIVQGDDQSNRDGDRLRSLGFKLRARVNIDNAIITAGREFCGFRLLICSGKRPLTSGDMPTYTGAIDPELINVIHDRYYRMNAQNWLVQLNKYVKFNRIVNYNGLVAVKNDLYMWIVPCPLGTGLTTTTGYSIRTDNQIYFKDM